MEIYQHRKAALEIIHEYYYALPNNGSLNHGLMSCDRRYKEAIQCALTGVKRLILTLEFISTESNDPRIMSRINIYDKVIGFNGYDPKECLYEPSMKFYTYDEFYNNEEPKKETPPPAPKPSATDEADKFFKVGDKVQFKGMGIKAVIKAIKGNILSLKVTDSDWNTTPVGSEFDYPYWGVDKLEQQPSLEKTIRRNNQVHLLSLGWVSGMEWRNS